MDPSTLINGLLYYLGLVILLTFHEFGHAWMAWKCGDDTAKNLGRCSLNPLVHLDPIGTFLIPMLQIFSPTMGRFLIGWAKPVPVNINNLRRPKLDDILVSMAGPWMNLALAVVLMGFVKIGFMIKSQTVIEVCYQMTQLSLLLCFFNLIPIPPLDGSHVARVAMGISYETYREFAQYGFIVVIIVLQIPWVGRTLGWAVGTTTRVMGSLYGLPF